MPFLKARDLTGAIFALSIAHTAQADVRAQGVWSNWQSYFESSGMTVSATQSQSGNTLTISDLTVTVSGVEGADRSTLQLGQVAFTDNDDGTVSVVMPEVTLVQMQVIGAKGQVADVELEVRQSGLNSIYSGVATEMTNTYTAQTLELALTGLTVDGEKMGGDVARANIILQQLSGTTKTTFGGKRVYDQDLLTNSIKYDFAVADPEGSGDVQMNGQIADVSFVGSIVAPLVKLDADDVSGTLAAGLSVNGTFKYSAGASNLEAVDNGTEAFTTATTSSGGALTVAIGADGLNYSGQQNSLAVSMASQDFPVPLEFDVVGSSFNLAMPVKKSDEPSDFAFGFALNDFSMSEVIWGIFDPSAQLPRNPATVVLDLTGKARVLFDFLDPTATGLTAESSGAPFELETLDINKLQVTVAGAELSGEGAFRVDNSASGDVPKPIGAIDLSLAGGNKLLDTLVAMGLLPEQQAMGARMMMGLLAVPGNAPDTLNSKIEINEQGHVMANGQRIQ